MLCTCISYLKNLIYTYKFRETSNLFLREKGIPPFPEYSFSAVAEPTETLIKTHIIMSNVICILPIGLKRLPVFSIKLSIKFCINCFANVRFDSFSFLLKRSIFFCPARRTANCFHELSSSFVTSLQLGARKNCHLGICATL